MRRTPLALALVALGHLVYVAGSLDPVTASTVFDLLTAILLGAAAWMLVARGETGLPRVLLLAFVMLAIVKPVDYLLSLGDGWQAFHVGWTLVAVGGILLGAGAIAILRGGESARAARWLRYGAWVSALGSLDYAILAAVSLATDGSGALFLVGAIAAGAGWAAFALAPAGANAFEAEGALA